MLKSLPNLLSSLRFVCALLLILTVDNKLLLFYLFTLAGITDWLDGYIAKSYKVTSRIGEILDPIADKALVICALLVLIYYNKSLLLLSASAIIIIREFVVSMMRQILSDLPNNPLKVNFASRVKALIQMLGIGTCFLGMAYGNVTIYNYGTMLITISALVTLATFLTYFLKVRTLLLTN